MCTVGTAEGESFCETQLRGQRAALLLDSFKQLHCFIEHLPVQRSVLLLSRGFSGNRQAEGSAHMEPPSNPGESPVELELTLENVESVSC